MRYPRKFYLTIAVVLLFLASLSGVYLLSHRGGEPEKSPEVQIFEENSDIFLYIENNGDATGEFTGVLSESKLSEVMKLSLSKLSMDRAEDIYINSIRSSFAMYGMELQDVNCDIQGVSGGGPLTISMTWRIPNFARRGEEGWAVSFDWVDNRAATRKNFAQIKESWVTVKNIAQAYDIPNARYQTYSEMHVVLPTGAQEIGYSPSGELGTVSFGGGTYKRSSIYDSRIGGSLHVVENEFSVMVAENRLELTPEELLEGLSTYSIKYEREVPESWTFLDSIDSVRLDLKYGRGLREEYFALNENGKEFALSPEQMLYYALDKILSVRSEENFSVLRPPSISVQASGEPSSWKASWKNISRTEYLDLARSILDNVERTETFRIPVKTSIGRISFRDVLYIFSRVLTSYGRSGELPENTQFAPNPRDNLSLDVGIRPSKVAYFLLPGMEVLTETPQVENVLGDFLDSGYEDERLARELSTWANEHIKYNYYIFGQTSEETLASGEGKCTNYANVYLALLRTAGIPSRRVSGWVVSGWEPPAGWEFIVGKTPEGEPIAGHAWTQIYLPEEGWKPVDPTANYYENLKYDVYLAVEQTWLDALSAYESAYGVL